ncbi:MAG: hypothetical protein JXB13_08170 [Phycisphaerae bacterium]|nr:hypothetical protein [Phycisphaerae bacterium]
MTRRIGQSGDAAAVLGGARLRRVAALAVVLCLLGGCGEKSKEAAAPAEAARPVTREAERGPVKLTVTCAKDKVSIAESLTLTLAVEAEPGVEVTLPQFGENLGEFQIRGFTESKPEPDAAKPRWEQQYDLDIFLSGQYSVPAMSVQFRDARKTADDPSAAPIEGTLSTEAIPIEVRSLVEGDVDPKQFRDIKGAVPLPVPPWSAERWKAIAKWGGLGAVVAAVGLVAAVWCVRRARRRALRPQAPHDWAFDQLRALLDEQWIEQGLVREFFYRLSEITRVYIEMRFGLMAAEQTTEEFLQAAHESPRLRPAHKTLLAEFLQACDMVKYARYEPVSEEIERAFHSARDFVEQTRRPDDETQSPQAVQEAAA